MRVKVVMTRDENARRHGVRPGVSVALDVEEYIKGVLPAEICESRTPMQAKCALAIVARTYAMRKALDGNMLADMPGIIGYRAALASRAPNCTKAVERTRGLVLAYDGQLIHAHFCNSNGGSTKPADEIWPASLPYYEARADPWDIEARHILAGRGEKVRPGHGVGLSLVGAEYAARLGEDYADILGFYYPGTVITAYIEEV